MTRLVMSVVMSAGLFGLLRGVMPTGAADGVVLASLPEPGATLLFGTMLVAIAAGVRRVWRQS